MELAYIAGLFDGEGCVLISKTMIEGYKYVRYFMYVSITNQDKRPLEEIKKIFGGIVYFIKGNPNKKTWGCAYRWQVANGKAMRFLKVIIPWLIIKKKEAELGILFQECREATSNWGFIGRPKWYIDMEELFRQELLDVRKRKSIMYIKSRLKEVNK